MTVFLLLFLLFIFVLLARYFIAAVLRLTEYVKQLSEGNSSGSILRKSFWPLGPLESELEKTNDSFTSRIKKLSASEGQLSAIVSSMTEGVFATNKNGAVVFVNPAIEKLFGIVEFDVLGKSVREAIRNNEIADLFEEVFGANRSVEREIDIISPVKKTFMAHVTLMASGAVCVLYDLTEIRRLENYRRDFIANVSHELKTPLTAIRNYVETLLSGALNDKEKNIAFLNKVEKHAINLSDLINDTLEISRLESKKGLGPFIRIDINKLLSRAVETVRVKAERKKIVLKLKDSGQGCFIMGVEDLIYRAFLNLLDNAIKYTETGGEVRVFCEKREGEIAITVSDNGIGIASDDLSRIFERFYRTDKARSRELGGTGLGLAIVKHIMNVHNGAVDVKSELEKGSEFTLIFPAK